MATKEHKMHRKTIILLRVVCFFEAISSGCRYESLAHLTLIYDAPSGQIVKEFEINEPRRKPATESTKGTPSSQPAAESAASILEMIRAGLPNAN
jgi:hypothetical protein